MAAFPQSYQFQDGPSQLAFPPEEYTARLTGLRQIMYDHDLAVVILTTAQNIAYYTGLICRPFGRAYALVVTQHDCTTIAPAGEAGRPSRQAHGDVQSYPDWERNSFHRALRSVAGIGRVVGYEADQMPVAQAQAMRHHLHPTGLIDISADTARQRAVLSDAERSLIRAGAAVADHAVAAMRAAIKPGVREIDVTMAGAATMASKFAETFPHAADERGALHCQSGPHTDAVCHPATPRALEKGDLLTLVAHPLIHGYGAPLARTCSLGQLAHQTHWELQSAARDHALSLIAPGQSCAEIARQMAAFYAERDALQYCTMAFGQALGAMTHVQGGATVLDLRPDNETLLMPGMGLSLGPILSVPADQPGGGGYREVDVVFVTDDGAETVAETPVGPADNVISV
ncbi:aminopeptidase P family protein [Yoonia sp. BS5-3]|uniref:Aminopeptidase P family protein n=1 Tax=Yoonia phaeophyticola TaxID=3137369 RepID=A0ABZ3IEQ6_9RHOB